MNQFYRALHMPPKRLLRKVMGEKEIYTIAVRPRPTAEGTEPLPALEGGPYTLLPGREGWWFADPLLYHRRGKRWLFAEAMDLWQGPSRGLRAARRRHRRRLARLAGRRFPPVVPDGL